ncbi:MAG: hypothetical protein ACI83P_001863, partial [Janthinobacterium sp.]
RTLFFDQMLGEADAFHGFPCRLLASCSHAVMNIKMSLFGRLFWLAR